MTDEMTTAPATFDRNLPTWNRCRLLPAPIGGLCFPCHRPIPFYFSFACSFWRGAPRAHGWGDLFVIPPDSDDCNDDLNGSDQKAGKKSEKTDEETKERYNEAGQSSVFLNSYNIP